MAPAVVTEEPPAAPPGSRAPDAPPRRGRGARRAGIVFLLLLLLAFVAGAAAIAFALRDTDETVRRTFDAQVEALPLGEPTSVVVSGVLDGEPLGRVAVVIQRTMPIPPRPGGFPVPLDASVLVFSRDGFLSLNVSGTLRLTRAGAEIVDARGNATNGTGDFEGVKGTFTFNGGRANPRSMSGRFEIFGSLEY